MIEGIAQPIIGRKPLRQFLIIFHIKRTFKTLHGRHEFPRIVLCFVFQCAVVEVLVFRRESKADFIASIGKIRCFLSETGGFYPGTKYVNSTYSMCVIATVDE